MLLLEAVNNRLGTMESWPSYILRYLFVENSVQERLKVLCAFFYSNGLPCHLAYQLYYMCNPYTTIKIKVQVKTYYNNWIKNLHTADKMYYYNLRVKDFFYVNSIKHVLPKITVVDFGINNTGHASQIHAILNALQTQLLM
jgi:hypothetical protein